MSMELTVTRLDGVCLYFQVREDKRHVVVRQSVGLEIQLSTTTKTKTTTKMI